jgi:aminoglycoside 2'-N-acetyltransferase I
MSTPATSRQPIDWVAVSRQQMSPRLYEEIVVFCSCAYEEDFAPLMARWIGSTHVLGRCSGRLVSHALWVTRWLQVGSSVLLRTAFVEAVATHRVFRGRGYASQAMLRVANEIADFQLAALSAFDSAWYARLGWERWRGPLFVRSDARLVPTPDENVMIRRLPRTPPLDLDAPLSAEWRDGEPW